ncbi:hypothetical protein F511_32064 [Dorcoceras hygrometricum]|uniref:Uncharacterized protein n=1 Tax=Dorcoceras hygrometricum TaxID=472368 RepID=A0A2Z7ACJ9_9LAMI|nr:hypothetical protein F511_32064 [Dorcoceras hygrometricum]
MSSDPKRSGNGAAGAAAGGGGGFGAKLEHFLYSGEKKHVAAGIAIIGVLFGVPWYLRNRGLLFSISFGICCVVLDFHPMMGDGVTFGPVAY